MRQGFWRRHGRAEEASGQRGVDAFEQLEENQAERVSMGEKLIAAGIWKLSDETFGPKLGEVIAEGGERIAVGRASKCLDDVGCWISAVVKVLPAAMCAKRTRACIRASWRG